jgi:DNA polymerase-3 subunit epsilon
VLDRFYELQDRIEKATSARDFDRAIALCDETVDMLPDFVGAWRVEESRIHAGQLTDDWFRISSIVAVETLCRLLPVRRDLDRLRNLRAVVSNTKELIPWVEPVDAAIAAVAVAERVAATVEKDPGIPQAGLAKSLGLDGNLVRQLLHWMEADGRIERQKEGRTYALYPAGSGPEKTSHDRSEKDLDRDGTVSSESASIAKLMPSPPDAAVLGAIRPVTFVALDFETATERRGSACALALTLVEAANIVGTWRWLIRPPGNEYSPYNTMIHGIDSRATSNAPEFSHVWAEAAEIIGERPVVAHHAAFDFGVLRDSLSSYDLVWPELDIFCTMVLARRAWPGLLSYSLSPVAKFLGVMLENHHEPGEDSAACAEVALKVCAATDTDSLLAAARRLRVKPGVIAPSRWDSCHAQYSKTLSGIEPTTDEFDPEHPFHGRCIVFTGTLGAMTRREAAQAVVNAGGRCTNSVSIQTHYLVFGDQDFSRFVDGQRSTKTRRAQELVSDGHTVEVISERDFLAMLAQ